MRCLFEAQNTLGEGPCWDPGGQRLFWFDIKQRTLFCLDDADQVVRYELPLMASAAAPLAGGGGLIIAAQDGLWRFDPEGPGLADRVSALPHETGFRSNDGKSGPDGSFWWSTMDNDGGRRPGGLFRYDGRQVMEMLPGIHIANSMAFSPDGETFYLSDSSLGLIWAFEHQGGRLGERRLFARYEDGSPDGAATDAEGCLWVAVWGGGRLDRLSPEGARLLSVPMPVSQPSSCIFGGPDLCTLYVTSAREGLSDETLAGEPLAGGLFALKPGVAGAPVPPFGG